MKKISESGGDKRSKIWDIAPDKGYYVAFCEDPFGNVWKCYRNLYARLRVNYNICLKGYGLRLHSVNGL